jgi:ubiquitin-conjugating enzyme E2 H
MLENILIKLIYVIYYLRLINLYFFKNFIKIKMALWKKRIMRDISELQSNGYKIIAEDGNEEFTCENFVSFLKGPKDSPYENCIWRIRFTIPDRYPFKSPSVGFVEKIFHPNIDEESGSICLDVLNTAWSPMFTIKHILENYLPLLLDQPNADDPLNREAAAVFKNSREEFNKYAKEHASKHSFKM